MRFWGQSIPYPHLNCTVQLLMHACLYVAQEITSQHLSAAEEFLTYK